MNETNQEDMSVEDILSSIKNILVDENGAPITEPAETPALEVPKQIPQDPQAQHLRPADDVFDLDSSMIIDEQSTAQDISRLLEMPEEPAPKPEPQHLIQQPIPAPQISPAQTTTPVTAAAGKMSQKPAQAADSNKVSEETIDASADIINNFAKLFAEKQQETNTTPAPTGNITAKIDAAVSEQNISDMVKNAIVNQVKICLEGNFEKIAANIIAEQTKNWLDQNLAAIVEKTVAREIERVIAKVGS